MIVTTILFFCFNALFTSIMTADTIYMNQTIRDGQTIVSSQEFFELGFFSPSNSSQNRYLGIWHKQDATRTSLWLANRETPIRNKTGELALETGGLLVLRDSTSNEIIWSSNSSRDSRNVVARLLDNGNFMVVDDEDEAENYIWQSFDHPTDTDMPEMKFGRNLKRGVVTNFTSWKTADDPSPGTFMVYMNFSGLPQIFQKNGSMIQYRLGSWNGLGFTGNGNNHKNPFYRNWFTSNDIEISGVYELINKSAFVRLTLTPEGNMIQWNWIDQTQGWLLYMSLTRDTCQRYGLCGVYGSCDIAQSPICGCLRGFLPQRPDQWDIADWSSGCRREVPLDCGIGEGFRKYSFMKLPDTGESWFDRTMNLKACKEKCTSQCNCNAYATLDIKENIGCLLWYNELIDMRTIPNAGQDIYIRMAAIELEKDKKGSQSKKKVQVILMAASLVLVILLGLCMFVIMKKKKKSESKTRVRHDPIVQKERIDLPLFSLSTLIIATNNFSLNNKLGEGGYGLVYKGSLEDGQEIAVKRLSAGSTQGVDEFMNEVVLISKLKHRNLIKVLGCCIEATEKILVYEYMPNSSLDLLLFETNKSRLEWAQRFHIIKGIARGLVYLHQDSQLLIIHRDLKASNILLDHDMNPKISDFGLARSFEGNVTERNTKRLVGTYGYMAPEFARDGIFSIKSDVFSFGVLILEIVSGKRNKGSIDLAQSLNLLGHAWRLFKEGKALDLADKSVITSCHTFEVLRSIHVGLLCIQHNPNYRPNMAKVVSMLSNECELPDPKQPGFYIEASSHSSSNILTQDTYNNGTTSSMVPNEVSNQ